MAIEFVKEKGGAVISTGRLWLTSDRQHVVADGDPEAAFLLAGCAGQEIPRVDAERLGLLGTADAKEAPKEEEKTEEAGQVEESAATDEPAEEAPKEEAPAGEKKGRKRGK